MSPRRPSRDRSRRRGFYTSQFALREARDLAAGDSAGLQDEIDLLKVGMRRVLEQSLDPGSPEQSIKALQALAMAAGRLASLSLAHARLSGQGEDPLQEQILRAVRALNESFDSTQETSR